MSSERPSDIEIVRQFHQGTLEAADSTLERAMRIGRSAEMRSGSLASLLRRFGNQNFAFGGMPFRHLREIFHLITPQPDEIFCDAGAGYGHAVFYGACVAACRFRAIEILPVRHAAMIRTARRLGLADIDIIKGDALSQSYDDVSYLFVNNPFFPDMAQRFADRLAAPRNRPLTVIAMHNIVDVFRGHVAFAEIETRADIPEYCFGMFRLANLPRL